MIQDWLQVAPCERRVVERDTSVQEIHSGITNEGVNNIE